MINKRGQLIVELLIAVSVAIFLIVGAAGLAAVSLMASRTSTDRTKADHLVQEAAEALKSIRDTSWVSGFENLSCTDASPATRCKATVSGGAWILENGEETVTLDGLEYKRKIIIEDVTRNAGGSLAAGFTDPLTKKATVTVSWGATGQERSVAAEVYLTRFRNAATLQTNWVGGTGQCNLASDLTRYCSNDGLHIKHSIAGEITLQ